ncbi:porin [Formosa haliotis]|uniref:porin n=1 Tax=Formosa haliotis TaxID=1555194 RepID=UPI000826213D|nr:porin [Formosa haliotis]
MKQQTNHLLFLAFLCSLLSTSFGYAQQDTISTKNADSVKGLKVNIKYTDKGFAFSTADNNYLIHIESRFQFRFATPSDQSPVTYDEVYDENETVFKINRARLKVGGHAYKSWLKYYWEYELAQGNLLDFRIMLEKYSFFKIKAGQWKTYYNRERVISSGKQQTVDRSILTRPFTIDRQQGVEFFGRLPLHKYADFTYNFSVLTGMGRGATQNDDDHLMYVGRLQYNLFGRELGFSGSDLDNHDEFTGIIAVAAATNRSPYTRFSQAGGGQLYGFEEGVDGQYRVNQQLIETAFMYRGLSWQNEFHAKEIFDHVNQQTTKLKGAYFQAGYFFHSIWKKFPKPLEIAGRYSYYKPNIENINAGEEEFVIACNWFFKGGHRNKLTAELTYFDFEHQGDGFADGARFRLQWDVSF